MPKEIISIHIGQCGNMIGQSFWEECFAEHYIDLGNRPDMEHDDISGNSIIMDELENGRWMPRAIFTDLSPDVIEPIRNGPIGHKFREENWIVYSGKSGAGNSWAVGHEEVGLEVRPQVLESLRVEVEKADSPNCVQMTHATGGGSGSGFGSLLAQAIHDNYGDLLLSTYSVIPPSKGSEIVVEPYNALLTLSELQEYADMVFMLDNVALGRFAANRLKVKAPKAADLNVLIAHLMSNVTAGARFPAGYGGDLRALHTNLVFDPRLKFMTSCLLSFNAMEKVMAEQHVVLPDVENRFHNQWAYAEDDRMTVASYESDRYEQLDAFETQSTSSFGSQNPDYNARAEWGNHRSKAPSVGSVGSNGSRGSRNSGGSRGPDPLNIPFSDDGNIPPSIDVNADPNDVNCWSPSDVVNWVSTLDNGAYAAYGPKFMSAEIFGTDLLSMSKGDLKEDIGIKRLVHRKKLYRHIQSLIGREETPRAIMIHTPGSTRGRAYTFEPQAAYEPASPVLQDSRSDYGGYAGGHDPRDPRMQQRRQVPDRFHRPPPQNAYAYSDTEEPYSRSANTSPRGRDQRGFSYGNEPPQFYQSASNLDPRGWRSATPQPPKANSFNSPSRPALYNRYSAGGGNNAYNPHKRSGTMLSLQVRPERSRRGKEQQNGELTLKRASSGIAQGALGFGNLRSLLSEVWESTNNFVGVKMKKGRFFAGAAMFRGDVNPHEALKELKRVRKQYRDRFVTWIPNNICTAMAYRAPHGTSISATLVCNHSSIRGVFQRVRKQFRKLYKKEAFLHSYREHGVNDEYFDEADESVIDLIKYISEKESAVVRWSDVREEIEEDFDFDAWQSVPIWATIPKRYGGHAMQRVPLSEDMPDDIPRVEYDRRGRAMYFDPNLAEDDYSDASDSDSFGDDDSEEKNPLSDSEEVSELRERSDEDSDDANDFDDSNEHTQDSNEHTNESEEWVEKPLDEYEEW